MSEGPLEAVREDGQVVWTQWCRPQEQALAGRQAGTDLGLASSLFGHAAARYDHSRPLPVHAHVRVGRDTADLTGLRVLLTADLLTRLAELGGLQVLITRAFTGDPAGQGAVERAATALGIHPPSLAAPLGTPPGKPVGMHVADDGAVGESDLGRIMIRVAPARLALDAHAARAATDLFGDHDPMAVRLALMSFPRHQIAELTAGVLASALETLGQWRRSVAGWAEYPSHAIPEWIAAAVRAAFGYVGIASALDLLDALTVDETLPPGARFETFAYTDRILGLDLARDIGR